MTRAAARDNPPVFIPRRTNRSWSAPGHRRVAKGDAATIAGLPVAGAARVVTAGLVLVMIGARFAAINAAVALDALLHVNHAHAVAARTFHSINSIAWTGCKTPPNS